MSGGSYDYAHRYAREMAETIRDRLRLPDPDELWFGGEWHRSGDPVVVERIARWRRSRERLAAHLEVVAEAMRAVEWVDSGDSSVGAEVDAIERALAGRHQPAWREVLRVVVPGPPVGAGRPRVVRLPTGASRAYMPDASVKQEMRLMHEARAAWDGRAPLDEVVRVEVLAVVGRPAKLTPRRHGGTLSGPGEERILACGYTALDRLPCPTKPDADNVAKLAMDALVKAGVLCDDTRVVEVEARKVYAACGEGPATETAVFTGAGRWW